MYSYIDKNRQILFLLLVIILLVYATNSFGIEFVDCFTGNTSIEQASEISLQVSETSESLNNDKEEKVVEKRKITAKEWINFTCMLVFWYLHVSTR
jgi:hypothetical protein